MNYKTLFLLFVKGEQTQPALFDMEYVPAASDIIAKCLCI